MSLILTTQIKERGKVTWPAIGEPDKYAPGGSSIEQEAVARIEWLREQIRQAAQDTRDVFGITTSRTVHVTVTFKPDIMVDPA